MKFNYLKQDLNNTFKNNKIFIFIHGWSFDDDSFSISNANFDKYDIVITIKFDIEDLFNNSYKDFCQIVTKYSSNNISIDIISYSFGNVILNLAYEQLKLFLSNINIIVLYGSLIPFSNEYSIPLIKGEFLARKWSINQKYNFLLNITNKTSVFNELIKIYLNNDNNILKEKKELKRFIELSSTMELNKINKNLLDNIRYIVIARNDTIFEYNNLIKLACFLNKEVIIYDDNHYPSNITKTINNVINLL